MSSFGEGRGRGRGGGCAITGSKASEESDALSTCCHFLDDVAGSSAPASGLCKKLKSQSIGGAMGMRLGFQSKIK